MKIKFLNRAGFTLVELMTVATLVSSVPLGAYKAVGKAKQSFCKNNLNQIYQALTMSGILKQGIYWTFYNQTYLKSIFIGRPFNQDKAGEYPAFSILALMS